MAYRNTFFRWLFLYSLTFGLTDVLKLFTYLCPETGQNFCAPFSKRAACQVSLNKNHIGWGGSEGIHPAILMNCAAHAFLNAALVSSI